MPTGHSSCSYTASRELLKHKLPVLDAGGLLGGMRAVMAVDTFPIRGFANFIGDIDVG